MLDVLTIILSFLSPVSMFLWMLLAKDFERLGYILATIAIVSFISVICIMAFTGSAPHIVDDQYMPISYP